MFFREDNAGLIDDEQPHTNFPQPRGHDLDGWKRLGRNLQPRPLTHPQPYQRPNQANGGCHEDTIAPRTCHQVQFHQHTGRAKANHPGVEAHADPAKGLGVDTASIDNGASHDFQVHRLVMAQNVPGFENLAHLEELPETGAWIVALPMKIAGGSGGPLRIVALLTP